METQIILKSKINYLEKQVTELKEKLMSNFCYHLAWIGEDIYKIQYQLEHYKKMLSELDKHSEEEVINHWINKFTEFISRSFNVRENSTGALFRECSTWKFICNMEMLEELKLIKQSK
jgi:hypothetical protein